MMRIGLITLRHPPTRHSPLMPQVARLLSEWGAAVDLIYSEEHVVNLEEVRVRHDLYVLKSGTDLALSLAGALHTVGATILNPYPLLETLRNKVVVARRLQTAGVPTPESFVTAHPEQLAPLLDDGPLILKPYRGTQGKGIHIIWSADELDNVPTNRGPVFAQRYHVSDGRDRKIYCIGEQVFGVMRGWPARTYEEKIGEPFTITPELREIALRCGRLFGLTMFGLDVIFSEGAPYVVDVNGTPGFKGVPDAALRLADHIYAAAQRVSNGEPLWPAAEKEFQQ